MNNKKTRKIFSTIVIVLVVLAMVVPMILGSLLSIFYKQSGGLRLHATNKLVGKLERILANGTILEDVSITLIRTMNTHRCVLNRIPLHTSRGIHVDEVIRALPTLSG